MLKVPQDLQVRLDLLDLLDQQVLKVPQDLQVRLDLLTYWINRCSRCSRFYWIYWTYRPTGPTDSTGAQGAGGSTGPTGPTGAQGASGAAVGGTANQVVFKNGSNATDGDAGLTFNESTNILALADQHQFVMGTFTTTQRDTLTSVSTGSLIYNTTDDQVQVYDGTEWIGGLSSFSLLVEQKQLMVVIQFIHLLDQVHLL